MFQKGLKQNTTADNPRVYWIKLNYYVVLKHAIQTYTKYEWFTKNEENKSEISE